MQMQQRITRSKSEITASTVTSHQQSTSAPNLFKEKGAPGSAQGPTGRSYLPTYAGHEVNPTRNYNSSNTNQTGKRETRDPTSSKMPEVWEKYGKLIPFVDKLDPLFNHWDLTGYDYKQKMEDLKDHSTNKIVMVMNFIRTKALWIIGLITMMSWSAAYHSLFTFVFLIWSIYLWTIKERETKTLEHSPGLVCYSIILVVGQIIYSFDLKDEELNTCLDFRLKDKRFQNGTYNSCVAIVSESENSNFGCKSEHGCIPMKIIGFERYQSSAMRFGNLATKICFTAIFILMLKEYNRMERESDSPQKQISFRRESNTSTRFNQERGQNYDFLKNYEGEKEEKLGIAIYWNQISTIASKYWIIILYTFQLGIGFTGEVEAYRIIYILIFLLQTILFQVSWRNWRDSLHFWWNLLVGYSIIVVLLLYVYQFPQIRDLLNSFTWVDENQLARLGLRTYKGSGELMIKIVVPTSFLLVCMFQRHLFHKVFMQMTKNYDNDKVKLEESNKSLINSDNDDDNIDDRGQDQENDLSSEQTSLTGTTLTGKGQNNTDTGTARSDSFGSRADSFTGSSFENESETNNSEEDSKCPYDKDETDSSNPSELGEMLKCDLDDKDRSKRRKIIIAKCRGLINLLHELLWDFMYIHSNKFTLMTAIVCGIYNVNLPHAIHVIYWIICSPFLFHYEYEHKIHKAVTIISTSFATLMIIVTLIYQMMNTSNSGSIVKQCDYDILNYASRSTLEKLAGSCVDPPSQIDSQMSSISGIGQSSSIVSGDGSTGNIYKPCSATANDIKNLQDASFYKIQAKYKVDIWAWWGLQVIDSTGENTNDFATPPKYKSTFGYEYSWLLIVLVQMLASTVRIRAQIKINIGKADENQKKLEKNISKSGAGRHYYRTIKCLKRGMVFPDGSRRNADKDCTYMIKYLINFGFYKFGIQICQIMTALLVIVRQDVYAVIYGLFMIVSLFISTRKCLRAFWYVYLASCCIGLIIQYLSLLGYPDSSCTNYNNIFFADNSIFQSGSQNDSSLSPDGQEDLVRDWNQRRDTHMKKIKFIHWLYLPSTEVDENEMYFNASLKLTENDDNGVQNGISQKLMYTNDPTYKPNYYYMVYDAIQLIMVLCQWIVFKHENLEEYNSDDAAGSNKNIIEDIDQSMKDTDITKFAKFCKKVPNFLKTEKDVLDYFKTFIFSFSQWATLTVLCAAGMLRTTIFSLIYLCTAFYLLSRIHKKISTSIKDLVRYLDKLIIFSGVTFWIKAILVMIKEMVEAEKIIITNDQEDLHKVFRWIAESFGTVLSVAYKLLLGTVGSTTQQVSFATVGTIGSNQNNLNASMLWETVYLDWMCFVCLLLQKRIFSSYYFCHVVRDQKAMQQLSSRGAILFNLQNTNETRKLDKEENEKKIARTAALDRLRAQSTKQRANVELRDHYRAVRAVTDIATFNLGMGEEVDYEEDDWRRKKEDSKDRTDNRRSRNSFLDNDRQYRSSNNLRRRHIRQMSRDHTTISPGRDSNGDIRDREDYETDERGPKFRRQHTDRSSTKDRNRSYSHRETLNNMNNDISGSGYYRDRGQHYSPTSPSRERKEGVSRADDRKESAAEEKSILLKTFKTAPRNIANALMTGKYQTKTKEDREHKNSTMYDNKDDDTRDERDMNNLNAKRKRDAYGNREMKHMRSNSNQHSIMNSQTVLDGIVGADSIVSSQENMTYTEPGQLPTHFTNKAKYRNTYGTNTQSPGTFTSGMLTSTHSMQNTSNLSNNGYEDFINTGRPPKSTSPLKKKNHGNTPPKSQIVLDLNNTSSMNQSTIQRRDVSTLGYSPSIIEPNPPVYSQVERDVHGSTAFLEQQLINQNQMNDMEDDDYNYNENPDSEPNQYGSELSHEGTVEIEDDSLLNKAFNLVEKIIEEIIKIISGLLNYVTDYCNKRCYSYRRIKEQLDREKDKILKGENTEFEVSNELSERILSEVNLAKDPSREIQSNLLQIPSKENQKNYGSTKSLNNRDDHIHSLNKQQPVTAAILSDAASHVSRNSSNPANSSDHEFLGKVDREQKKGYKEFDYNKHFVMRFAIAIWYLVVSKTEEMCFYLILLNTAFTENILTVPLPISIFCWAALSVPRPSKRYWNFAIYYLSAVIVIKYVISLFAVQKIGTDMYFINDLPFFNLGSSDTKNSEEDHTSSWLGQYWIWLFKYLKGFFTEPEVNNADNRINFHNANKFDIALLVFLFFHRSTLKSHGLWVSRDSAGNPTQTVITVNSEANMEAQENENNQVKDTHIKPSETSMNNDCMTKETRISYSKSQNNLENHQKYVGQFDQERRSRTTEQFTQSMQFPKASTLPRDKSGYFSDPNMINPPRGSNQYDTLETVPYNKAAQPMAYQRSEHNHDVSMSENHEISDQRSHHHHMRVQVMEPQSNPNDQSNLNAENTNGSGKKKVAAKKMKNVSKFYSKILAENHVKVTDKYTLMFLCDIVSMLIVGMGYRSFGASAINQAGSSFSLPSDSQTASTSPDSELGSGSIPGGDGELTDEEMIGEEDTSSLAVALKENHVPRQAFYILLVLFCCMLIDRAIYLKKSKKAKIFFQYVMVVLTHFAVFLLLPYLTNVPFYENSWVMGFYMVRCLQFLFSAEQIRGKYPTRILQNFLTTSYGYTNLFPFFIYQILPFIVEIKNTMDWMFVDTTLCIGKWFMLNTVYEQIYVIKCWRFIEDDYKVPRGEKKAPWLKYTSGGFMLLGLVILLWFPLLFVHVVQTVGQTNSPRQFAIRVSLEGYDGILYESSASKKSGSILNWEVENYEKLKKSYHYDLNDMKKNKYNDYDSGSVTNSQQEEQSNSPSSNTASDDLTKDSADQTTSSSDEPDVIKDIQKKNSAMDFMSRFSNIDFVSVCLPEESSLFWRITWPQKVRLESSIRLIKAFKKETDQEIQRIKGEYTDKREQYEANTELTPSELEDIIRTDEEERDFLISAQKTSYESIPKITLLVEWDIYRDKGKYPKVSSDRSRKHALNIGQLEILEEILQFSKQTQNNATEIPTLAIQNLLPKIIYAKDYSEIAREAYALTGRDKLSAIISRKYLSSKDLPKAEQQGYPKTFWSFYGKNDRDSKNKPLWSNLASLCPHKDYTKNLTTELVVVSDRTAPDVLVTINNYGVIGLYISAILVIGRLLRSVLRWDASTIAFTELPNVDRIWALFLGVG